MKLTPLADRVILKMVEVEETTKGGIILTASAKEKPSIAEVISVGPGGMVDGHDVVMTVKPGDKVITSKYSGTEIKVDGVEGILDMVRSSGNMYLKAEEQDGTEKLTLLVLDGKAYQLDSARKLAICLGDEAAAYKAMGLSETVVAKSLSAGSATGFASERL